MMVESQQILHLSVAAGEVLLKNGAEIFRVQETVIRILEAFGITDYHVYVIANGIFATINEHEATSFTAVRHVPLGGVHLGRITAVNQLSREISQGKYTAAEALEHLQDCACLPYTDRRLQVLACGVGSACFCYIFGGMLADSAAAFLLGLLLHCFVLFAGDHKASKFISNIAASGLVTLGGALLVALGIGFSLDKIIIGSIIPLVPGVALTTAIRDFFNGDYLSGSIHLIDAVLIGVCIAVGVGASLQLRVIFFGGAML